MTGFCVPPPPIGDGQRIHGICEAPEVRAERITEARAEIAAMLRVPVADVDVLCSRHSPTHELIRGQWLPDWRR